MAIFEPNIYMREIKELYSEELALLKQIRSYGREHSQGKMERVEKVKLLLLFRIYSNLYSSLLLTVQVLKTGKISFFQLPIGLLLRCCFTDCLFALYIRKQSLRAVLRTLIKIYTFAPNFKFGTK